MGISRARLDYLLNRFKTGQASAEELRELDVLLQEDWNQQENGPPVDHINWRQMLASIKQEERDVPVRSLPRTGWLRVAAAVLLLAGVGTVAYLYKKRPVSNPVAYKTPAKPIMPGSDKAVLTLSGGRKVILDSAASDTVLTEGSDIVANANGQLAYNAGNAATDTGVVYNTLSTPRGGQYRLTLPDGTKVWLNAASSIEYPTAFRGKERAVTVTGETYFEVVKNVHQPFLVRYGKMAVTVLGTSFNVNAYPDENGVRTSLIDGSIKVSQGDKTALLVPGQQAVVDSIHAIQVANMSNPALAIAWKNGYFSFEKADIPTVMRQLSRWYNIDVTYENGAAPADYFWGDLKRNANLSDIFAVLAKSGIHFTINGNKVLVLSKH